MMIHLDPSPSGRLMRLMKLIRRKRRSAAPVKGDPLRVQRGESVPDEVRKFGGVETWLYNVPGDPTRFVTFGSEGLVRYSSDIRP